MGVGVLNCRVRDGNGWNPAAMTARNLIRTVMRSLSSRRRKAKAAQRRTSMAKRNCVLSNLAYLLSVRAISTGQLQRLLAFHPRPINVVVSHDPSPLRD